METATATATGSLEAIGEQDHERCSEYRIFGPPGTGKTTNITRQIQRAVTRYGADNILVTSFSRAAAAELVGRDLPIARERVGTLHSHCWHALGGPEIAEAEVDEWNRENPDLWITPVKKQHKLDGEHGDAAASTKIDEDGRIVEKTGDDFLGDLNRMRGLEVSRAMWSPLLRDFERRWTEYKVENGLLDFTDLIETSLRDIYIAPGAPRVIFADEAQDLNRQQLKLVRQWGSRADFFVVAGDDDQTIYSFTGATPDAFLLPEIPEDHKIVLRQSYRVPRAVYAIADRLIKKVKRRQQKIYLPRDADGFAEHLVNGEYLHPEGELLRSAEANLAKGKSVMFLVSCAYMLAPLVRTLRRNAIPFHNPYRRNHGTWNPLPTNRRGNATNRILALLVAHPSFGQAARPWTYSDFSLWAEWLASKGVLRLGVKKRLASLANDHRELDPRGLLSLMEEPALDDLVEAFGSGPTELLDWWHARVNDDTRERLRFTVDVAKTHGAQALIDEPKVIVGTIHSVKGGEADVVYLFPDLSRAGYSNYCSPGAPCESVIRQFYVGATRARESLYICPPSSEMSISLND